MHQLHEILQFCCHWPGYKTKNRNFAEFLVILSPKLVMLLHKGKPNKQTNPFVKLATLKYSKIRKYGSMAGEMPLGSS
jgi:hypothetical protein